MRQRLVFSILAVAGVAASAATPGLATETIAYTYDALGRLVKVVHNGSVNNNLTVNYQFDAADNRSNVSISNASQ